MDATEELPAVVAEPILAGRYRLGQRLGSGGFGTVYAALDERLDRQVAVKVIPSDGPAPERARREAIAAARLDHPGIVALLDAGQDGGSRYHVTELVRGRTLGALFAGGALSDRDVLRIGLSLADALDHAHERGVVHRDVKPQNVLVPDEDPAHPRWPAKLTDFGVAHLAGDEPLTVTGDVVGTLAYMAPEQAAGQRVDHRTDLYSLALVLFEGLAGFNPIRADSPAATARRLGSRLPSLRKVRSDLPAELIAALDRALSPGPEERGTLEDLADALADSLHDVGDEGGTIAPHPLEGEIDLSRWERVGHGVLTGALTAAALGPEWAAAGVVAALLPRLGWLAAAAAVIAGLTYDGRAGVAALVVVAVLPVPILLRTRGTDWSLPALAMMPAFAGLARRWFQRAALGALGAWWLLLLDPPVDVPRGWRSGAGLASADVIAPLATSGAAALCGAWALAAVVMPWLVRGRSLGADLVGASVWAATLGAGTASIAAWLGRPEPPGLAVAAIVAGALAMAGRRRLGILRQL
jgi:hypothetical protein